MGTVFIVDGPGIFLDALAFLGFVGGWAMKGLVYAVASEIVFRPLARKIKRKADQWEKTHPQLLKWAIHYLENHKGLHPHRGKCRCASLSLATSLASPTLES